MLKDLKLPSTMTSRNTNYRRLNRAFRWATALLLVLAVAAVDVQQAAGQYFGFGKNRVQYTAFDWRFIQSEHFDVYYYGADNYYLGEFTANALEASYAQLRRDFRHEINDRIVVIIYDSHTDFSQTNVVPLPVDAQGIGGVTDRFKNRITMPFMGHWGDFRQVLQHELLHAVFNDMFYGGTIQSIIQNNIQLVIPLWFEEGLAEYISLGWDTDTDMFIRTAVLNNYMPPIPQMGGFMAYRGGQAFWHYIVSEYGREKIGEILQNVRTRRSVEAGLRASLGVDMTELNDRFQDWLRVKYFPEVERREDLREIATLVTTGRYNRAYNTSPAISPAGDRIAMISNARGFFDVVVVDARTGSTIKTLIRGEDNVDFEELNILRPNLSWSPDGRRLTLSTRSGGSVDLAIVEYSTGNVQKIVFSQLDAIGSVSWSPDGEKIAFQGNSGPFTNIYIYNLETGEFTSATDDLFSDWDPSWTPDSESILFASDRGAHTRVNDFRTEANKLLNPNMGQSDIYMLRIGDEQATRLTSTPRWNEFRPIMTREGRLLYVSDQNGIPNVYEMDLETRTSYALTDLITGVLQMSVSADGRRLAINSYNRGFMHIFVLDNPLDRRRDEPLVLNRWAERRNQQEAQDRVPALGIAFDMFREDLQRFDSPIFEPTRSTILSSILEEEPPAEQESDEEEEANNLNAADTTDAFDFRDYVFSEGLEDLITVTHLEEERRTRETRTEDGRFVPRRYRLTFSPDITYGSGGVSTYYGTYALAQFMFSDLLGNHQISLLTSLQFDLRNSNYEISYGYFARRWNYQVSYFHNAVLFNALTNNFDIQQTRFRFYGARFLAQYPIDKFTRIDFGTSFINISRDLSQVFAGVSDTDDSFFIYPQITYTSDRTRPGFLSPIAGRRYALSVSGSPPLTSDMIGFVSLLGDARQYLHLGANYVVALRGSGATSFGPDPQSFYMGGVQNWINQRWGQGTLLSDRLENIFFTLPAVPQRGHFYSAALGNTFGLVNAEFRFPLFAAILPGPIPILPLYNIQGVAFFDAGGVWDSGNHEAWLVGSGFGLRTIFLGLPFRWDVGWPYDVDSGGFGRRIHYFSIGLDF